MFLSSSFLLSICAKPVKQNKALRAVLYTNLKIESPVQNFGFIQQFIRKMSINCSAKPFNKQKDRAPGLICRDTPDPCVHG